MAKPILKIESLRSTLTKPAECFSTLLPKNEKKKKIRDAIKQQLHEFHAKNAQITTTITSALTRTWYYMGECVFKSTNGISHICILTTFCNNNNNNINSSKSSSIESVN